MLTTAEIAAMRTTVESALTDTASIVRRTAGTLNAATGDVTVTPPAALWSGLCRVRSRASASRDVQIGDAHAQIGQYVATLPVDADGFDVGDYLTVTSSATGVDLIGVPMQIIDIQLGTWDLGRRLMLQSAKPHG